MSLKYKDIYIDTKIVGKSPMGYSINGVVSEILPHGFVVIDDSNLLWFIKKCDVVKIKPAGEGFPPRV